ncbi:unnamed protein product [Caenorhabditis sp. 36 PRJEB53466]|nr:unnamed protein product [Caenorhabditis sp. 36 PRJEB53466]
MSAFGKILRLSADNFEEVIDTAVTVISKGGIVALPTDTLYGVSTLLPNSEKLYALKKRPSDKPLDELAESLLPGPVTLMFDRLPTLPYLFNPGVHKVACRVPNCQLVMDICRRLGQPLAQTSANFSGSPQHPTCIQHFDELIPEIDLVIDSGEILTTMEGGSTIVDLSSRGRFVYLLCMPNTNEKVTSDQLATLEGEDLSMPVSRSKSTLDGDFVDEKELEGAIQVALLATSDLTLLRVGHRNGMEMKFSEGTITCAAAFVWDAIATQWSDDLSNFMNHANRRKVQLEDVALIIRRNPELWQAVCKIIASDTKLLTRQYRKAKKKPIEANYDSSSIRIPYEKQSADKKFHSNSEQVHDVEAIAQANAFRKLQTAARESERTLMELQDERFLLQEEQNFKHYTVTSTVQEFIGRPIQQKTNTEYVEYMGVLKGPSVKKISTLDINEEELPKRERSSETGATKRSSKKSDAFAEFDFDI